MTFDHLLSVSTDQLAEITQAELLQSLDPVERVMGMLMQAGLFNVLREAQKAAQEAGIEHADMINALINMYATDLASRLKPDVPDLVQGVRAINSVFSQAMAHAVAKRIASGL